MIIYDDVMKKLSDAGWSTYRLVKEHKMGNSTLARLRKGESVSTETIDTICKLCSCQPADLLHYEDRERD